MARRTTLSPYKKRIQLAVAADLSGQTYRSTAAQFRVPIATLFDNVHAQNPRILKTAARPGRLAALTPPEEENVVSLLTRYAERGIPLRRSHLQEAIEIVIARMPAARRMFLPFKNGKPGTRYLRNFTKRHAMILKFARPLRQEACRFCACNAETLTSHLATVEKIVIENNIDPERMWNLDESGATPGRDANGKDKRKVYMTRAGAKDAKIGSFLNSNRVTIMPVISAAGRMTSPLFVFRDKRLPYWVKITEGSEVVETFADHLPRQSLVSVREQLGGVDTHNFYNWACNFVRDTKDLTANGRKLLLIYDGYRSHMSLQVLQLLHQNGIIVYALPAHTSGKTQPLDVCLFSPFKDALNEAMNLCISQDKDDKWDTFSFCDMLKFAYEKSFTPQNIKSGFRKAGLYPLDSSQLLSVPRPVNADNLTEMLTVDELERLFEAKRQILRTKVLGEDTVISKSGFVDTSNGAVLTSVRALALAEGKFTSDTAQRVSKELRATQSAERASRREEKTRAEGFRLRELAWSRRALQIGVTVDGLKKAVRPLQERRATARHRVALKRKRAFEQAQKHASQNQMQ